MLQRVTRLLARAAANATVPMLVLALPVLAQQPAQDSSRTTNVPAVTITATRQKTDVHDVAAAVSVVDDAAIREQQPNSPSDLLRELPGVDVVGVGANQTRPSIRGQVGQRILLLEDGMRLNNSRREQDFGELPALVDPSMLDRMEIVRGPASVLYGTDAIGGVINLITHGLEYGSGPATFNGRLGYRYGDAGDLSKGEALFSGNDGAFAWQAGGSTRHAANYDAPAGTFGSLHLAKDVTVLDAGVRDHSEHASIGWRAASGANGFIKVEQYVADDAGFGYVPNGELGGDSTKIAIRYPHQDFKKLTVGASSGPLGLSFVDRADLTAYTQRNQRDLAQDIFVPFGPGTPPGAGISVQTANYTDIATIGARLELTKILSRTVLTYGLDAFQERAFNTDTSTQTVIGFGPPQPQGSNISSVPNAVLSSAGAFAQASIAVHERLTLIVGARAQQVQAEPKFTPGVAAAPGHTDATGVYAVSALVRLTSALNLVATLGTGFRAPNLVERYFSGPTPEGGAYEVATPDLRPESSVNTDLGLKYRTAWLTAEATVFESNLHDGITIEPTGDTINQQPVYKNVNVSKLRTRGAEVDAMLLVGGGVSVGGNWSTIKSTDVLDPNSPIGNTFANKLNLSLGWAEANGRHWVQYVVRREGEQKDIVAGSSPVGDVLPAFTVHSIRGGFRGWTLGRTRQDLTIAVNNLTNTLYSEAANASFFRPEPKRNVSIAISTAF